MNTYHKLAQLAANQYYAARDGNPMALLIESIYCLLATEEEEGRLNPNDETETRRLAEFVCDGAGITLDELLSRFD